MNADEKFRQACLVIAQQLRYGVELSGYYKRLAKKYPELLEAHAAGIRALRKASRRRP